MWTLIELNKTTIDSNLKEKINQIMKNKNLTNKDIAYGNFLFAKHEMEQKNIVSKQRHADDDCYWQYYG